MAAEQIEDLVGEQRALLALPLTGSERRAEGAAALAFVVLAVALLRLGDPGEGWHPGMAVVLVLGYAAATRVRFETGLGSTDASLLAFVPMLFALPPCVVPVACAGGLLLGRARDYASGRVHPSAALTVLGNSLHAVGPAAVFTAAVDGGPEWADWPWYLLAFLAYAAMDTVAAVGREAVARGVLAGLQLRVLAEVYALDALLAPVGLMAAFATARAPYAFLLGAPLLGVLWGTAREREGRLDKALELSESRRALLEAQLRAAQGRGEVLAAVSHGLQLPLASVLALADLLRSRGDAMASERRAALVGELRSEALVLRQLVRQALDYVALRDGRELRVDPADVDVAALAQDCRGVAVAGTPALRTDPGRLRQVLLALAAESRRAGGGDVAVSAAADGGLVAVATLPGPPRPDAFALPDGPQGTDESQGAGIDLPVARAICAALGGVLDGEPEGDAWRLTARVPSATALPG